MNNDRGSTIIDALLQIKVTSRLHAACVLMFFICVFMCTAIQSPIDLARSIASSTLRSIIRPPFGSDRIALSAQIIARSPCRCRQCRASQQPQHLVCNPAVTAPMAWFVREKKDAQNKNMFQRLPASYHLNSADRGMQLIGSTLRHTSTQKCCPLSLPASDIDT